MQPVWLFILLGGVVAVTLAWWAAGDAALRGWLRGSTWRRPIRLMLTGFVLLMLGTYAWTLGSRLAMYLTGEPLGWRAPTWVQYLGMIWPVLVVPWLVVPCLGLLGAWWVSRRGAGSASAGKPMQPQQAASTENATLTRRGLLQGGVKVGMGLGVGAGVGLPMVVTAAAVGSGVRQNHGFAVRRVRVPLAGLHKALEGMRIAHVTDSHVGSITHGRVIDDMVEATNALDADLVAFTGDLINYDLADLDVGIDMLRRMRGRYGTFVVEGNHDLMHGQEAFEVPVRRAGLNLLVDEIGSVVIEKQRVQLLGLPWTFNVWHELGQLQGKRQRGCFDIILAHHPHAFDHASHYDIPLTLAGHTHGGQIMVGREFGAGPMLFKYWSGLYEDQRCKLHVSNGVGNWFPVRIGAPAEIVELTLVGA